MLRKTSIKLKSLNIFAMLDSRNWHLPSVTSRCTCKYVAELSTVWTEFQRYQDLSHDRASATPPYTSWFCLAGDSCLCTGGATSFIGKGAFVNHAFRYFIEWTKGAYIHHYKLLFFSGYIKPACHLIT